MWWAYLCVFDWDLAIRSCNLPIYAACITQGYFDDNIVIMDTKKSINQPPFHGQNKALVSRPFQEYGLPQADVWCSADPPDQTVPGQPTTSATGAGHHRNSAVPDPRQWRGAR